MIGPGKKEIDTNAQSQTSPLFQYFLMDEQKTDITLTAPITEDDEVINVSPGHGFTAAAGEYIAVRDGDVFTQKKVIDVNTNAITVDMPIANDIPVTADVIRGNINMNVDGSSVPVDFKYSSNCCGNQDPQIPIDLSTIIITMQHGSNVPDDGKFGGIAALTKGMYFRKMNGGRVNLGNYINNQAFKDVGAEVEYTSKAPAGTNATNILFDVETIFGQVVRMDPRLNDFALAKVRDNISPGAGMAKMTISLVGSFTSGE
jgi:hypothetical protein